MEKEILKQLYDVVQDRKATPQEGSYTCYLFEKGLDKILKKVGEEAAETIIAAKGEDKTLLRDEICDLLYHLVVLMAACDLPLEAVTGELARRAEKIGNLKPAKSVDRNT